MNQFHQPWKLIPSHVRGKGGREIGRFRGDQLAKDLPDGSECWVGAVNTVNNPPADNPYKGCSKVILPDGKLVKGSMLNIKKKRSPQSGFIIS